MERSGHASDAEVPELSPSLPPPPRRAAAQADKLLSPEFQPLVEKLVNHCHAERQICLFSATFPVTVKNFKEQYIQVPGARARALAVGLR